MINNRKRIIIISVLSAVAVVAAASSISPLEYSFFENRVLTSFSMSPPIVTAMIIAISEFFKCSRILEPSIVNGSSHRSWQESES